MRRCLLLAASAITLLACSDAASPADLAISIIPDASQVQAGDTLRISVTVVNVGDQQYTVTSTGCPRPFHVYDSQGEPVFVEDICAQFGDRRGLEPGDSYTFAFNWATERVVVETRTETRTPLEPGSYLLKGVVATEELGVIEAGGATIYIGP